MRKNSKTIGDVAELKVATYFAEQCYYVSRPLTDNAPYDLIVDNGSLKKIQIKSRAVKNGVIRIELKTSSENYTRLYQDGDFDMLAVYVPELKKLALIPWNFLKGKKELRLRVDSTKNKQKKGITFFKEYTVPL